ncbi:MAG TPA: GNAT family N-acetyltransferase [Streptosporangiaceae bacterium]
MTHPAPPAADIRAAYDAQVRQRAEPDQPGACVTAAGGVVRTLAPAGQGPSRVTWSDLDAASADGVIAAQVAFFAARGEAFEWKLFDYDQPADLGTRLAAAGLLPEEEELIMAAPTAQVAAATAGPPPDGVRVEQVHGAAGVDVLMEVSEQAFGADKSELRAALLATQAAWPDAVVLVAAFAGDKPVSAARAELLPGTDFAGLWGGGTLPDWRGRGLYRALVGLRAALAAERGYRYLQVDALPTSAPILSRLGFAALARSTPYTWEP